MRFDFRCSNCGEVAEFQAKPDERWVPCGTCRMPAQRQFNTQVSFMVPSAFRLKAGWNLPPRNSPKWESMVAEGSVKPEKQETFREFVEAQK